MTVKTTLGETSVFLNPQGISHLRCVNFCYSEHLQCHIVIVIFKGNAYKLQYTRAIPFKNRTEFKQLKTTLGDLGCHFEHLLPWAALFSHMADSRMALGVLGSVQECVLITSRTCSSTHKHMPCISYCFMESSEGGSSLPTPTVPFFHHLMTYMP